MKRILYLTFYFRPDLCAGSFRNSPLVDELALQIQDTDIEVDVLTTSPNRYSTFREDYKEKEQVNENVSVERVVVPSHQSGMKDQIMSFKTYFFEVLKRTRSRKYDLVFASSSRFFTSYLGYLIAKQKNIPLYLDVRDLFSETMGSISSNPFIKYLITPLIANREKRVYQYATHINLISEGFRGDFTQYPSTAFSFYTHGVDPVFQKAQPENSSGHQGPKKILYAGNIGEGQGLHKIIPDAAKKLPDTYEFEVIGAGGALHKLQSELSEKKVENVTLSKPVEREKLVEKYLNSDILFIHLNDLEIFKKVLPSKIFELAVIQKPIVAGVNGYAKTFLQKHVPHSYIFAPGDVNGLLEQIKKIDRADTEPDPVASKRFAETFSRKKINEEMAASIKKILSES